MKRLVATGIVAATVLLGACSGGGYGSVGPGNTDSGNLPGGGTPPPAPTASTALFQVNAGVLPYPTDLYFAGSTDGTHQYPAAQSGDAQPGGHQRARRFLHHRGDPRELRRRARPDQLHRRLGPRRAGGDRQPDQGDDRRRRRPADARRRLFGRSRRGAQRHRCHDPRNQAAASAHAQHLHPERPVPGRELQHRQRLPRHPHQRHQGHQGESGGARTTTTPRSSRPSPPAAPPARASPTRR